MKKLLLLFFALGTVQLALSQRLISPDGHVWFASHTPIEDFEAHNHQVVSILEPSTGSLLFSMLVRTFVFETALMQEHFNENYMESEKFPKADFAGVITNLAKIRFDRSGTYPAEVAGDLSMHGVTKSLTARGTIQVRPGEITASATFLVRPADYGIVIPVITATRIASEIEVHVAVSYPAD